MIIKALTVFVAQLLFIYFRTLNVKFISNENVIGAITSGMGVGALWIYTTYQGVTAAGNLEDGWAVVVAHLCGGIVGTLIAMRKKKTKNASGKV